MFVIDRYEEEYAVIASDDKTFNLPRALMPESAREGDVITILIKIDKTATARKRKEAQDLLEGFFDE